MRCDVCLRLQRVPLKTMVSSLHDIERQRSDLIFTGVGSLKFDTSVGFFFLKNTINKWLIWDFDVIFQHIHTQCCLKPVFN